MDEVQSQVPVEVNAEPSDSAVGQVPDEGEPVIYNSPVQRDDFLSAGHFLRRNQAGPGAEPGQNNGEDRPDNLSGTEEVSQSGDVPPATFKLADGRQVTPEQIAEWEKGSMMQADYTRKTQALAAERRALEQERQVFAPFKEQAGAALQLAAAIDRDPIGTLDKLVEYYNSKGISEAKDPATLARKDRERRLVEENRRLKLESARREEEAAVDGVAQNLVSLADKYGEKFDMERVVDYAVKNGIYDPEKAFKAMIHDQEVSEYQRQIDELQAKIGAAKHEGVKEYVQTKITKGDVPLPVGAGGGGAPPVQINSPRTLREARKAALARLGGAD